MVGIVYKKTHVDIQSVWKRGKYLPNLNDSMHNLCQLSSWVCWQILLKEGNVPEALQQKGTSQARKHVLACYVCDLKVK